MPDAAHLLTTNSIFKSAKPDGLTVLAANPNVAIAVEQVRFDVRKSHWLEADGVAMSIPIGSPLQDLDELKKAARELDGGTTDPDPTGTIFAAAQRIRWVQTETRTTQPTAMCY